MVEGIDVLCDVRNLIRTFDAESFDIVICTTLDRIYDWRTAIHNIKSVCKTGGLILICLHCSEWKFQRDIINKIFADFNIEILEKSFLKAVKVNFMEVNLKNIKPRKTKATKPKIIKEVAKYIGDIELYFPQFRKIVNKGDLLPELPLWEAIERRDFIVIESEDK